MGRAALMGGAALLGGCTAGGLAALMAVSGEKEVGSGAVRSNCTTGLDKIQYQQRSQKEITYSCSLIIDD
jgi:hypothetical protein